jgi:hypothetical protein
MAKLTNAALKRLIKRTGRHADGGGLYFRVLGEARAYWVYRYRAGGRVREMSIGPYPEVNLAEARDRHAAERAKVRTDKRDPLAEKRAAKQARATACAPPTFGAVADDHLLAHQGTRKNAGHRRQWFVALTRYCAPIRDLPVDAVDTEAVLRVLRSVWTRTPDTGSRLRGMIERVLDAARARGLIDENRANPARWRGHSTTCCRTPTRPASTAITQQCATPTFPPSWRDSRTRKASLSTRSRLPFSPLRGRAKSSACNGTRSTSTPKCGPFQRSA